MYIKVPMKWNLFLFSFKIYLVKYAIPKFKMSGVKSDKHNRHQISFAYIKGGIVHEGSRCLNHAL